MIRNVVFDLGGVVVNYRPWEWLDNQFHDRALEERVFRLIFESAEWQALDRGEMDYPVLTDILTRRAAEAGIAEAAGTVLENWFDLLTDRPDTIRLMGALKASGYGVYFLSNTEQATLDRLERRPYWKEWDGGLGSCHAGICKPDRRIFTLFLEKFGMNPKEVLFIDDSAANAAAAAECGIYAHHYTGHEELLAAMRALGIPL